MVDRNNLCGKTTGAYQCPPVSGCCATESALEAHDSKSRHRHKNAGKCLLAYPAANYDAENRCEYYVKSGDKPGFARADCQKTDLLGRRTDEHEEAAYYEGFEQFGLLGCKIVHAVLLRRKVSAPAKSYEHNRAQHNSRHYLADRIERHWRQHFVAEFLCDKACSPHDRSEQQYRISLGSIFHLRFLNFLQQRVRPKL